MYTDPSHRTLSSPQGEVERSDRYHTVPDCRPLEESKIVRVINRINTCACLRSLLPSIKA